MGLVREIHYPHYCSLFVFLAFLDLLLDTKELKFEKEFSMGFNLHGLLI